MMTHTLDEKAVRQAEDGIDRGFDTFPLPTSHFYTTRFALCARAEDNFRLHLHQIISPSGGRRDFGRLVGFCDRMKYALRSALDVASRKQTPSSAHGPIGIDDQIGMKSVEMLQAAENYALAVRIFSSHHAGQRILGIDAETGRFRAQSDPRNERYNTLEFLVNADDTTFSSLPFIAGLFFGEAHVGYRDARHLLVNEIVGGAEVRNNKVKYKLNTRAAEEIYSILYASPPSSPNSWQFPWGSLADSARFFAALQTLCAYNLIAIHFTARSRIRGMGVNQICYSPNLPRLKKSLASISGLSADRVSTTIEALTLGKGVKSPDPALQPIVPIGGNCVSIPSFNVLSSNWVRNMLSLHARLDSPSFDRQSKVFEQEMLVKLVEGLTSSFRVVPSKHIPTDGTSEEIDAILIDREHKVLLLLELRWILQPGDAREVITKRNEALKKVAQIERKVSKVRQALPRALASLGLEAGTWTVEGMVVIDGFGGLPSNKPKEFPIVPLKVALEVFNRSVDLLHAHALFTTPIWLPRPGVDFDIIRLEEDLFGVSFDVPSVDIRDVSYMKQSLPRYIEEAMNQPTYVLRSAAWA